MFSKFYKTSSTLKKDLKKVTEATSFDVDKELLWSIVDACEVADNRQEIMRHLQACMSEVNIKRWRRIWGALHILEAVLQDGESELIPEMAFGLHFDVVWKATLLARFEYSGDQVAESCIREKASRLRRELLKRQEAIQSGGDMHSAAAVVGRAHNVWAEATATDDRDEVPSQTSPWRGAASPVPLDVSVASSIIGNKWADAPVEEEGGQTETESKRGLNKLASIAATTSVLRQCVGQARSVWAETPVKEQDGKTEQESCTDSKGSSPREGTIVGLASNVWAEAPAKQEGEQSKTMRGADENSAETTFAPTLLGRGAAPLGFAEAVVVGRVGDPWVEASSPKARLGGV